MQKARNAPQGGRTYENWAIAAFIFVYLDLTLDASGWVAINDPLYHYTVRSNP